MWWAGHRGDLFKKYASNCSWSRWEEPNKEGIKTKDKQNSNAETISNSRIPGDLSSRQDVVHDMLHARARCLGVCCAGCTRRTVCRRMRRMIREAWLCSLGSTLLIPPSIPLPSSVFHFIKLPSNKDHHTCFISAAPNNMPSSLPTHTSDITSPLLGTKAQPAKDDEMLGRRRFSQKAIRWLVVIWIVFFVYILLPTISSLHYFHLPHRSHGETPAVREPTLVPFEAHIMSKCPDAQVG